MRRVTVEIHNVYKEQFSIDLDEDEIAEEGEETLEECAIRSVMEGEGVQHDSEFVRILEYVDTMPRVIENKELQTDE